MSTLEDILDQLYFSATDERDKGDKFERLMVQFFKTDLQWSERFSDVWMWMDWPDRRGRRDNGIDLVATDRQTGDMVAIQCKFFDPGATLYKQHIDSFLSESGKRPFAQRLVVTTTDHWGPNAEAAVEDQQIPVQRLRFMDLAESSIDWSQFDLSTPEVMELKERHHLRKHQIVALEKVREGFATSCRGKLIMACGTGKTFTSLKIAEDLVPRGGTVLFMVPSLSLLSQSLREWSIESEVELRPFAVCSDTKIGKRTRAQLNEDISVTDLALPATTNAARVYAQLADTVAGAEKITVIFSTYQSIGVVAEAQQMGLADFDLVICDEAHRTTGTTLVDEDESAFVRVHDNTFIHATRRLYMTATPRIYDDASKAKAGQAQAVLASMDDELMFGPEFHRLGFGEAVSKNLLTDYKVLVLAVDEKSVSRTFQAQMAQDSELKLSDVAKIVGCWNGLAKRGHIESGFAADPAPMTRAVAFARSIKDSQKFASLFKSLVADYITTTGIRADDDEATDDTPLICEVEHVDGTFNVLARNERLDWLKGEIDAGECRVLSNARCLSEGVDVPALDAVMFLNPRKSVVDVVQSVGRVMRRSAGKHYGYIILPIGIPADMKPEDALKDNERYAVVWEVLQALRAHDERFDAMVNKIDINRTTDDRIQIIGVGGGRDEDRDGSSEKKPVQGEFVFPELGEWREAIYAKIVQKVGSRRYWEDWAKDVALIAETHTTRIKALLEDPSLDVEKQFEAFLAGLRGNLNDSITSDDAIDMLSQHLVTKPVFDALFEDYSFAEHNPVSKVMQSMLDTLEGQNLTVETQTLDKFYESVRLRAAHINNAEGKQKIVNELYEKFFKNAFPRAAESLGIVYTPVEIVDFIIRSVDHLLGEEFGASISDPGVHVLDPFTGTGTFIVRLLESGLIRPDDLLRKYTNELHANEILLLAYYIAAINIEATFHGIAGQTDPDATYVPFDGIVLTDTFQMTEDGDTMDEVMFPANNARVEAQKNLDIRVIIANPPYSAKQSSQNDNNRNLRYPTLDAAIADTYASRSTATLKNSLYDSYIRAIRWATDRIKDQGIIGFVTNGGFIDGNTADGLRKTLADDFTSIYVYNLRGNSRMAGELAKREGGNVFNVRVGVAITLLVKHPSRTGRATVRYRDIGDYLTREQKLKVVAGGTVESIDWQTITPNNAGDWTNQRTVGFDAFAAIGSKDTRERAIFRTYSGGLKTNRDAWVTNFSQTDLEAIVGRMVDFYNSQVDDYQAVCELEGISDPKAHVDAFINLDPTRFSWDRADKPRLARGVRYTVRPKSYCVGSYRPFAKQRVYFNRILNNTVYQLPTIFPTPEHPNLGFVLTGVGAAMDFTLLMTDAIPDLSVFGGQTNSQLFPRFTYVDNTADTDLFTDGSADRYTRIDNITDEALADYRTAYGIGVSKDDLFYYVYGLLHSPDYRTTFAADLKKMLPRIPKVASSDDFRSFVAAGRELATLHIGYESGKPYPLNISGQPSSAVTGDARYDYFRVEKMQFGGTRTAKDRSVVVYNSRITVSGIPKEAYKYMLGSRSAIEWILERYQVKTEKASRIVNDPNDWSREVGEPRYILDLLARIVTVSLETMKIVDALPKLEILATENM
jgi:predicted helicase